MKFRIIVAITVLLIPGAPAPAGAAEGYNGPEARFSGTLPVPSKVDGLKFTIGFLSPNSGVPVLLALQKQIEATTHSLGGSLISKDAHFDVNTQVNQFNELLAQGVDAIIFNPLLPGALAPSLQEAKKRHIPVIAIDSPADVTQPTSVDVAVDITVAHDIQTYLIANAAAKKRPGAGFVLVGSAKPVSVIRYTMDRLRFWAEQAGLKYLGTIDAADDSASSGAAISSALLARFPTAGIALTYSDQVAAAVSKTAAAAGKNIDVWGANGEKIAFSLVKYGALAGSHLGGWRAAGTQAVYAAYDILTKQDVVIPKLIVVPGVMVTKQNVDSQDPL